MLSRRQQIVLKRAQRQAALSDDDYRDALQMIAGCRSSTAPALTDRHLDKLLAYFEAIHWRAVDAGALQPSGSATAVFRQRGYWASKNTGTETSRDRYNHFNLGQEIADLERRLAVLGFGKLYCEGIRNNATKDRQDAHALHLYRTALERTLNAKIKQRERAEMPV
jgi:hypothetical protein